MARPRTQSTLLAGLFLLFLLVLLVAGCKKKADRRRATPRPTAARDVVVTPARVPAKKPPISATRPTGAGLSPEKAPHPDYPTASLARTDKIFVLEEPDRGPLTVAAQLPDEKTLRFTAHAHCELDHDRLSCGPGRPPRGLARAWRVGRRAGPLVHYAERRFGPRVELRYLLSRNPQGQLERLVEIDAHGSTSWGRHFETGGKRYSERRRSGANRLAGCGRRLLEHDDRGFVRRNTCLQWGGTPMQDSVGVVRTDYQRDARGLVVAKAYFDALGAPSSGGGAAGGRPMARHDGVHRYTFTRDAEGRVLELRAFDLQGFPVLSSSDEGCHGRRYVFDARGLNVGATCLGPTGKPADDRDGACRHVFSYDGRGCHVATQSYANDGDRCARRGRSYRYTVDAQCQRQTQVCYSASGERSACGVGEPAERRYARDALGRVTSTKSFAPDGRPGGDADCGAFEERLRYDVRGNVAEKTYHGVSGEPVDCGKTGFHGLRNSYDAAGRVVERRFVGRDGLATTNLGTAVRKLRQDNYDHLAVSTNYGVGGQLAAALGAAINRQIYDGGHRLFGILLFDEHDKPARYRGCYTGRTCPDVPWHAMRVMRETNGNVSRNLFFDRDGQLIRTVLCSRARCWK